MAASSSSSSSTTTNFAAAAFDPRREVSPALSSECLSNVKVFERYPKGTTMALKKNLG
jgi:hypothetical protein